MTPLLVSLNIMHVCMHACMYVCMYVCACMCVCPWNFEIRSSTKKNGAEISEAGAKSAQQQPQRGGFLKKKFKFFF